MDRRFKSYNWRWDAKATRIQGEDSLTISLSGSHKPLPIVLPIESNLLSSLTVTHIFLVLIVKIE